jgi:hypothetical protein
MILPNKYINLSESLFGFAAYLSQFLNKPISLDELWNVYQKQVKNGNYPVKNDFNELVLSIDLLYLMGLLYVNNDNELELIKNNTTNNLLTLPEPIKHKTVETLSINNDLGIFL